MTRKPINTDEILNFIKTRATKAIRITRTTLHNEFDISLRRLRTIVREFNQKRIPLLPSSKGYYYSDDPKDIRETARWLFAISEDTRRHGDFLEAIAREKETAQAGQLGITEIKPMTDNPAPSTKG